MNKAPGHWMAFSIEIFHSYLEFIVEYLSLCDSHVSTVYTFSLYFQYLKDVDAAHPILGIIVMILVIVNVRSDLFLNKNLTIDTIRERIVKYFMRIVIRSPRFTIGNIVFLCIDV